MPDSWAESPDWPRWRPRHRDWHSGWPGQGRGGGGGPAHSLKLEVPACHWHLPAFILNLKCQLRRAPTVKDRSGGTAGARRLS